MLAWDRLVDVVTLLVADLQCARLSSSCSSSGYQVVNNTCQSNLVCGEGYIKLPTDNDCVTW